MSSQNQILLDIYKDDRTVFPLSRIVLCSGIDSTHRASLLQRLNYYAGKGELVNIRKGIYAKPDYDPKEVACCIYTPSYISLDYVLQRKGVIFQYDEALSCISYLSRDLWIDSCEYRFRKVKEEILIDRSGIVSDGKINIATPERAFLDAMYLDSRRFFDNLRPLDKGKILELLPIYGCKKLEDRVNKLLKQ